MNIQFEEDIKKCQIILDDMNTTLEILMQQSVENLKKIEKLIAQNIEEDAKDAKDIIILDTNQYNKIFLELTRNNLIIDEEILKLKISMAKNLK